MNVSLPESPDKGLAFSLSAGETIQIGRSQAATTRLTDPAVSRVHCEIEASDDQAVLHNISTNGTLVNGNAVTEIELVEGKNGHALFRLLPRTGKKHQLRLHMASMGFPILGDRLYPEMSEKDGELPLQLIARRLEFVDPASGAARLFCSLRKLTV